MKAKIKKQAVDKAIEEAARAGHRVRLYDSTLAGFGFTAAKSGGGSYFVEYRLGGRGTSTKRLTLGKHGPLTPTTARELAMEKLGEVVRGVDVAAKKQEERCKLRSGTFRELAETYLACRPKQSGYWRETRRLLEIDVYPTLGTKPLSSITKQQIRGVLDITARRSKSVERALFAALRPIFKWGVERGTPETNPMDGLTPPPPSKKRTRVLEEEELRAFWIATGELEYPFGPLFRLLLLTAARREEVAGMRWEEIDLERRVWRLPPTEEVLHARTKNGKEHIIDLNEQSAAILHAIGPEPRGLVFTTTGETAVSGFSKPKKRIDALMTARLGKLNPWRTHDLRRTVATHMAEHLDIDEGVIERILNHITTTDGGLKGVYQRQQYREKRKAAMKAWGDHTAALSGAGTHLKESKTFTVSHK
jgi:integrase